MRRVFVLALVALAAVFVSVSVGPPASAAKQKPTVFGFRVIVPGLGLQGEDAFRSVSGLTMEVEVVETQDGQGGTLVRPGRPKVGKVVLGREYRGVVAGDPMREWFRSIVQGKDVRHDVTIEVFALDEADKPVARYVLHDCFPTGWNVPDMDSDQSGMAIEKIEIAVERVEEA
jgi:phage tail-like protein